MALSLLSVVFLLVISLVNLVGVELNLSDAERNLQTHGNGDDGGDR